MPNRRVFELIIVGGILLRPVFGLAHLWALKTLNTTPDNTFLHGVAEIVTVLA